ncbi:MAG: outer membrane beta-barrel protein [Alphaproteobacteria bacterium]
MKKILFLLLVFFLVPWYAYGLRVTALAINNDTPDKPFVTIHLDSPQDLKVENIDSETFVVHFPVQTQWSQKKSDIFGGLIKSFTYVPYGDGTGDLVFKVSDTLKLDQFGLLKNQNFGISFQRALQPEKVIFENPLVINNIRVGQKGGNTRVVLDMNRVVDFVLKENPTGTKIILIPNEKPQWKPKMSIDQPVGRFKKYTVYDNGNETSIELSVVTDTKVLQIFLVDQKTPNPKLVLDLGSDPGIQILDTQTINKDAIHEKEGIFTEDLTAAKEAAEGQKGLVKKMDIISQGDDTILRLESDSKKEYKVVENTYLNQVVIHLPKTDWKDVMVPKKKGGLIQDYTVDQSDPVETKLVLSVQKGTSVIGKKVFSSEGTTPRFIIYLNQNATKTPEWLVEETTEKTSYRDRDLEAIESTRLTHRGGISPYMSVGEGFYVGVQLDQLATQTSSHSTMNGTTSTRQLSGDNFGGGGHAYLGYGLVQGRFYEGLELRAGGYGVEEKTSYTTTAGNIYNSTSAINFSWDASLRLGGYISPTTLLYGRIGAAATNFSYDEQSTTGGAFIFPGIYSANSRTGFVFGVGVESALTDQLSLRLEGTQINYQPFQYNSSTGLIKKDRNILNQVSLGVSYKPSPMAGPSLESEFEDSIQTGFYFGFDTGIGNMMNVRELDGKGSIKYKGQSGSTEPLWGIFTGYSYNIGRFFLSGEFQGNLNSIQIQETFVSTGPVTTETYSNKLKNVWALTARPGYIFNHGTMGYGRLGLMGGSLVHKASFSSSTSRQFTSGPNSTTYVWGVRAGGGLEVFMNPNVSLRADYTIDYVPHLVFKDPTVGGVEEKVSIINNQFKIGLAYTLD